MATARAEIGMGFDRTLPPAQVMDLARRLEAGGADQLWVVEDCFYTAGISLAAAALAVTERLRVGIGILPAVARTSAVTAMELATLAGLAPGRVLAGIGHGVQSWMAQMGARTPSPVTTLEEVLVAVHRLLAGERVTTQGRHVQLDDVQLDQPPDPPPPVLAGVRGPRSLAVAGRAADGLVLAEPATPSYVRAALDTAGRPEPFHVATYAVLHVDADRTAAWARMAPWLASQLDDPNAGVRAVPFADDLLARYAERGVEGLVSMPREWWVELAPIGTLDDAREHIDALEAAGARSIALFAPPAVPGALMPTLESVLALTRG